MNELRALQLRRLFAELDALDPAKAEQIAKEHAAALRKEADLRRWQCPLCWTAVVRRNAPEGWLICEPFTRVAACKKCRPLIAAAT